MEDEFPESCFNGLVDGACLPSANLCSMETDIDCGGEICPSCYPGQRCRGAGNNVASDVSDIARDVSDIARGIAARRKIK